MIIIVVAAAITASAQTQKGNWLVGGSGTFASTEQGEFKVTSFGISPTAGYFIADNLAIGASLNFTSYKEDDDDDAVTSFSFGPLVRYYFVNLGPSAKLFGQADLAFGSTKYVESEGFTEWGISAGPAIFLNPHTALEITLGYGSQKYKDADDAANTFGVNVGFQIHLGGGSKK